MKFEYNPEKSAANRLKHGIDFEDAQDLWDDDDLLVIPLKFEDEPRQACIGRIAGKHWTAIITCRCKVVRIISVRRARTNEVKLYESEGI